ncbi:hypothetical protein ABGC58_003642 [Escherichia coli]|nr:hypothetical protein [Escherichia coli]EIG1457471.1 hypothetical protein [Escherichia coli]
MILGSDTSKIIDFSKALGISLVVLGHLNGGYVVYYFHMPLFFFISGILIKYDQLFKRSTKVAIRTYKHALFSYLIIGLISLLLSRYIGGDYGTPFKEGVWETIKYAFHSNFHNNSLFLVCWFLICYSLSYILSSITLMVGDKELFKIKLSSIISLMLGAFSILYLSAQFKETSNQIYNLSCQVLYASMFMILGRNYGLKIIEVAKIKHISIVIAIFLIIAATRISMPIGMSWSKYPSGFVLSTITSLLCIIALLQSCALIYFRTKTVASNVCNTIIDIGKYTRQIMTYHILVFVIIDISFSIFGLWDMKNTTALTHFGGYYFLPLYVLLGVLAPYFVSKVKITLKK